MGSKGLTPLPGRERLLTETPYGKVLTNVGVWSAGGEWIVFDVRSDAGGNRFDGDRIERVHVQTGEVQVLYRAERGAKCGVATCSPRDDRVAFILGPENPTPDWSYGPSRRRGVLIVAARPGDALALDARDLVEPFTPGALRGGSHVHVFSPDTSRISFTYDDELLTRLDDAGVSPEGRDVNQRNVGVALLGRSVDVPATHARNRSGTAFSVLVTRTVNDPRPGSDEIGRACEEGWIGEAGYVTPSGDRRRWALAFQGTVAAEDGSRHAEVFVVDLPDDPTRPGDWGPLQGTATRRPAPPAGTLQRRLTFTDAEPFPGIDGPRHWLRSSPDGSRIAFLRRDPNGAVRLWTVPPWGGEATPITSADFSVESAFTWSPDGRLIAHLAEGGVCVTAVETGETFRLTEPARSAETRPRPEACVFSPDGSRVAFARPAVVAGELWNQIAVVELPSELRS